MTLLRIAIVTTVLLCSYSNQLHSQNCLNDVSGLVPIPDLGSDLYQGYEGGLYFGSNIKPLQHSNNLNSAISKIIPLNNLGYPDNTGAIVLLSIGASNPKTEFQSFQNIANDYIMINPYLEIINGSQGGNGLQKIIDPNDNYWQHVNNQLTSRGLSRNQVQIIWLEQENTQSNNTQFPEAPIELMNQFKELFKVLLDNFPNLQICYLTARGYSGYIDNASEAGNGLRQPRDYYQGWAMKWLIENQISGDSTLMFEGTDRKAPLLDWSAYLWADGKNQRIDGFNWTCPADVKPNDGLHWSQIGNDKAGNAIFQKFITDDEAKKWFTNIQSTGLNESVIESSVSIFPNPSNTYFQVDTNSNERVSVYIYNILGQLVKMEKNVTGYGTIQHQLPTGIYHLVLRNDSNAIVTTTMMSVYR